MGLKLPLWGIGVVVTILSPVVNAMSNSHWYRQGVEWNYVFYFDLICWGIIGAVYLFEKTILKREIGKD